MNDLKFMTGFGNEFATEAEPGALPEGRNSPQKPPYGLYPEQLNGSAFTAPRGENIRSWLYKIQPSVIQSNFRPRERGLMRTAPESECPPDPSQLRWDALPFPTKPTNFIDGIVTMATCGSSKGGSGLGVHHYACNKSMENEVFCNHDGEFLIVPEIGGLTIKTEFGILNVKPTHIAVIPRGVKFAVELDADKARGYICENFGARFILPGRGPIGANGLANERDFLTPKANYEDIEKNMTLVSKFCGNFWEADLSRSPFDVVAWHGNYAPYQYDLNLFNTVNTVSFDHPDPSIFTVLTSPSGRAGTANCDFVIFPPRWMVAENTFRPPYYHRNIMSEYMGLIHGSYDAKPSEGFQPGGASLHNCMSSHGPDADAFESASSSDLKPEYQGNTLAFMFETCLPYEVTRYALESPQRQTDYLSCWQGLKSNFNKKK